MKKRVAILGTGNIGTDLLIKVARSEFLDCVLMAGRNYQSNGMLKASELGIQVSNLGIDAVVKNINEIDIVFDATSAKSHFEHWEILKKFNNIVIDMTPAKLGEFCVPAINTEQIIRDKVQNINMVTCGGQASVPIAYAIAAVEKNIEYIEVASSIASLSAGPATRANLDEYIETTEQALLKFGGSKKAKAILILNPANPPIDMQTTIYAKIQSPDIKKIRTSVEEMVVRISQYVPGYELIVPPTLEGNKVMMTIKVRGNGDYLPRYAGNLDIINCAAIGIAEEIAKQSKGMIL